MSNRCERCGGPPPVEGETYRHFWPCGCAVVPEHVEEQQHAVADFVTMHATGKSERCFEAAGLGVVRHHPTRDGAIAAWRAALGPYRAPKPIEYYTGPAPTYKTGEWVYISALGERDDVPVPALLPRPEPSPPTSETAEVWSMVGCPCGACGTWAVVYRDPLSSTSRGTCTCGTDWFAWDKQTSAQRRRRLGL